MTDPRGGGHQELVEVIRQVRRRWRTKLLLGGGIIVIGGGLIALTLASWALQELRFSPASVTGFRIAFLVTLAALVGLWLVRPMRRRVTDLQVALYVEEHEPSLQAAMLSAVDIGATTGGGQPVGVPRVILDRMVEQAVDRCRSIHGGREIGRTTIRRRTVVLGVLAAVVALLFAVGPEFFRQGASALLVLSRSAEAASPYAIKVTPGDVTVPKGSDQSVTAILTGFRSSNVTLMMRADGDEAFQRVPLVEASAAGTFEGMLFDLKKPLSYYVEADGVASPTYKMALVELPAVDSLELEYVFPAYTGLPPQTVESGGDVAALRGTQVRVKVKSTMTTPGGTLALDPGAPAPLSPGTDGILAGAFTIADDGYYHVELTGPKGEKVTASPKYTIDALDDQPPTVTFEKPKRDIKASPVEEVFLQVRADDDFGVRSLDLVYSVNGGPEKAVSLYNKGPQSLTEVSGSHTVYLEEMEVKAGDFVSYYAKATDTDTVKGPKSVASDIYFIEVRPFRQDFRRAQSQAGAGGGGGGGGQQNQAGALSEQQRQIMSATYNVERDKPKMTADKFKEDTVFVGLSQSKLREEVEELVGQMRQRLGGGGTENLRKIAELLPKAATEMRAAEAELTALKPKEARAPQGRALKFLQEAEQLYALEVQQGGGRGGGGGGGGGNQNANELADLFQLELDRMANQYEMQQQAAQQQGSREVDEIAERLRELARRQLQAEEQRARAQQGQPGGGSGDSQRALAEELERTARQLEQLRREAERQGQPTQALQDAARRLQESANAMRQAAANGQAGSASAQQAAQRLQEAAQALQQQQTQQTQQSIRDTLSQAEALARRQNEIAAGVRSANSQPAGQQRDGQMRQLSQQKDQLRQGVAQLEQQLDTQGRQALSAGERESARKLQEAAGTIRSRQVKEIIDYSKQLMSTPDADRAETRVSQDLETVRQRVSEAVAASDKAQQGRGLERATQQAGNLLRGLSTLNDQMSQQGQNGRQGQQGLQGEQGQQGQQGQGRQGQQGQGQQGQQGQGRQGQQGQGQQGQQGQGQQGQQGQGQQGQQGQGQQGQQGQGQQGQGQQGQGQQGQGQQGEGGQQGQGGRQGQGQGRGGELRLGEGDFGNRLAGGPAGGDARAGGGYSGDPRQLRNQFGQMSADAAELRRQLQAGGGGAADLRAIDEVARALREMGAGRLDGDPRGLQDLTASALETMRKLEFDLRKRTDPTSNELYLSGADDAPPQYRPMVSEYFRELSRRSGSQR